MMVWNGRTGYDEFGVASSAVLGEKEKFMMSGYLEPKVGFYNPKKQLARRQLFCGAAKGGQGPQSHRAGQCDGVLHRVRQRICTH